MWRSSATLPGLASSTMTGALWNPRNGSGITCSSIRRGSCGALGQLGDVVLPGPVELNQVGLLPDLIQKVGSSTAATAYLVLRGSLELAVADDALKKNPADSPIVSKPRAGAGGAVQPWTDAQVLAFIDAHPAAFQLMPVVQAGCGLRWSEAAALAVEDFDFQEQVLHVRRQLKKLGTDHIYALPKNDRKRDVPLPDWVASSVRAHLAAHRPRPCTLAWESTGGKPRTHSILLRWTDDDHVTYRSYSETRLAAGPCRGRPHSRAGGRP